MNTSGPPGAAGGWLMHGPVTSGGMLTGLHEIADYISRGGSVGGRRGVGVKKVRKWIDLRGLPAVLFEGRWRVSEARLEAWLQGLCMSNSGKTTNV